MNYLAANGIAAALYPVAKLTGEQGFVFEERSPRF